MRFIKDDYNKKDERIKKKMNLPAGGTMPAFAGRKESIKFRLRVRRCREYRLSDDDTSAFQDVFHPRYDR
jgi:hypothetical protein